MKKVKPCFAFNHFVEQSYIMTDDNAKFIIMSVVWLFFVPLFPHGKMVGLNEDNGAIHLNNVKTSGSLTPLSLTELIPQRVSVVSVDSGRYLRHLLVSRSIHSLLQGVAGSYSLSGQLQCYKTFKWKCIVNIYFVLYIQCS